MLPGSAMRSKPASMAGEIGFEGIEPRAVGMRFATGLAARDIFELPDKAPTTVPLMFLSSAGLYAITFRGRQRAAWYSAFPP
jgi:hypothetical protein